MTDSLIWVLDKAAKVHHENSNGRVAVIDSAKIPEGHIFHATPLCVKISKTDKKYFYRGKFEWLVWGCIPNSAIVSSYSFNELLSFANQDDLLAEAMQLHSLGQKYRKIVKDGKSMQLYRSARYTLRALRKTRLNGLTTVDIAKAMICLNQFMLQDQA